MVESIYISNPDYQSILEGLAGTEIISLVKPQQMQQISQMATPPGVLAVCRMPDEYHLPEQIERMRIFFLDSIRDPGNLGTILRIADWFGLDFVILSPDCVDIYNHKVLQSSMGSALRVKTCTLDNTALLSIGAGKIYVCDSDGKDINSFLPPVDGIIVLGNESLGVSGEIAHQVKDVFAIPKGRSLGAESLNVASAAAIVAAWWVK
jgi:TrmH family RNA methyltransferase